VSNVYYFPSHYLLLYLLFLHCSLLFQFSNPFDLATAAFRKLRSRQNKHLLTSIPFEYNLDDDPFAVDDGSGFSKWKQNMGNDSENALSPKSPKTPKLPEGKTKRHNHKKKSHDIKHKKSDNQPTDFNFISSTFSSSSSSSSLSPKHHRQHEHQQNSFTRHGASISSSDVDDNNRNNNSSHQMLQERERRAAETREQELKQKFEKERAELAAERATMVKQLNKMRDDIEQQQAVLEQKQAAVAEEAEEHKAKAKKLERQAARDQKSKMSNAQQLMNSVSIMGKGGPTSDSQTQTIVDEECLWETEGTKETAISGATLERIWAERQEAADKYYGKLVVTRKYDPLVDPKDELGMNNSMRDSNQSATSSVAAGSTTRGKGGWLIPPSTRHFMSNLPKTVESQPIKTLPWLTKTIDEIYQAKLIADYYDNRDGDPLQSLPDFLCEYLLMKYGLRRVAEMHLYEVVMAVKKYFSKNPKVLMFARFLGCVKIKHKMANGNAVDRHSDTPELDIGVLQVFLYTRRRLLLPSEVLQRETDTPGMLPLAGADKKEEDEGPGEKKKKKDVDHTVHTNNQRTYVPLGHAILEMRRVTAFMAPRKLIKFMRTIERGVAMRRGDQHDRVHPVSNDTGGQTAVRFVMRNSMLGDVNRRPGSTTTDASASGEKSRPGSGTVGNGGDDTEHKKLGSHDADWRVVCCLDTSLEVLLDILELRSKQVYEELVRAFVEGDDNGDGVLSFDEFEAIIQNKRPEFSSRRALRMFKLALESGGGNSTAIERPAFVRTCKQFGLGKLVSLEDL
jgi:hypothetical protein